MLAQIITQLFHCSNCFWIYNSGRFTTGTIGFYIFTAQNFCKCLAHLRTIAVFNANKKYFLFHIVLKYIKIERSRKFRNRSWLCVNQPLHQCNNHYHNHIPDLSFVFSWLYFLMLKNNDTFLKSLLLLYFFYFIFCRIKIFFKFFI